MKKTTGIVWMVTAALLYIAIVVLPQLAGK